MYVQQVDQKVNLLESILLDMKVSHEITSFSSNNESPALESIEQNKSYMPYSDDKNALDDNKVIGIEGIEGIEGIKAVSLDNLEPLKPFQPADELEELNVEELHKDHLEVESVLNYDLMSLKELQSHAKSKGVSTGTMKKNQLIEILKGLEQSGLKHGVVGSSFIVNSALVSNDV